MRLFKNIFEAIFDILAFKWGRSVVSSHRDKPTSSNVDKSLIYGELDNQQSRIDDLESQLGAYDYDREEYLDELDDLEQERQDYLDELNDEHQDMLDELDDFDSLDDEF
jgi:chromosome segregation ATPase